MDAPASMGDRLHAANCARFIAADDMIVRWERQNRATFEPETTHWMFAEARGRAGLFVDVGAGTGWFSIPMALCGRPVVAFEPNPTVAGRLRANMLLNDVAFDLWPAAASDAGGSTTMWLNPAVRLTSGGSIERATCRAPVAIDVARARLDDAVSGAVALIKVDVEGHELAVLAGAETIVARDRPRLMLEANDDACRAALADWLAARGYAWRRADGRNMLCWPA